MACSAAARAGGNRITSLSDGRITQANHIVAVVHGNSAQCLALAQAAVEQGATCLEFRADLSGPETCQGTLERLKKDFELPILLTARHQSEGGDFAGDEAARYRVYKKLMPYADIVDCEVQAGDISKSVFADASKNSSITIGSYHDFKTTPDQCSLTDIYEAAIVLGADVCKLAVTIDTPEQFKQLASLFLELDSARLAVVGMGKFGPLSRVVFPVLGSRLTYGFVGDKEIVPGQLTVQQLSQFIYQLRQKQLSQVDLISSADQVIDPGELF